MSKTAIVFSCAHSDPSTPNDRFDWLGEFIYDVNPNYIVDLGDGADMRSLNSFDTRRPEAIVSQNYERDIDHYNDAMDRLRRPNLKRVYKKPRWYGFEGNHENRIKTAISHDPRLEGDKYGVSFGHLQTDVWFDEYHEYHNSAPAIHNYDGVAYAHFFTAGNFGRPISGVHHAYALIQNNYRSSICGHTHKRDVYFKDGAGMAPSTIGLVAGCYKGSEESWAGQSNANWWKGVVVLRNIENGVFEPEFVSMDRLKKEYT